MIPRRSWRVGAPPFEVNRCVLTDSSLCLAAIALTLPGGQAFALNIKNIVDVFKGACNMKGNEGDIFVVFFRIKFLKVPSDCSQSSF